jgi:formylmethanofuran dehydrogenase subunit E
METITDPAYEKVVAFHGHSCPGLAIGYRMTKAALAFLSSSRAPDEELVAIVENNACGVDAVQFLSGCTFGKGNFIFKDYGKHVYTFYDRKTKRGVRVVLSAPEEKIVSLREVRIDEPEPARIMKSITCASCGESVMETRTREIHGKTVCIPCAQKMGSPQNAR